MREKQLISVRRARIRNGPFASDESFGNNGYFVFNAPSGAALICIVSEGRGWDHVSVRAEEPDGASRVPTWGEMCLIKELFWGPGESVVQYHPRKSQYVNNHPHVLHLWRPQEVELPEPPPSLLGIAGVQPDQIRGVVRGKKGWYVAVDEADHA